MWDQQYVADKLALLLVPHEQRSMDGPWRISSSTPAVLPHSAVPRFDGERFAGPPPTGFALELSEPSSPCSAPAAGRQRQGQIEGQGQMTGPWTGRSTPRWVLRLSRHLAHSLSVSRSALPLEDVGSAHFPCPQCWGGECCARRLLAFRALTNLLVVCLDCMYADCSALLHRLWRHPSSLQLGVHRPIGVFVSLWNSKGEVGASPLGCMMNSVFSILGGFEAFENLHASPLLCACGRLRGLAGFYL